MANNMSDLDADQVIRTVYIPEDEALRVSNLGTLVPEEYDEIDLSYTGDNLTGVVYKSLGMTVATLTLSYSGDKLIQVLRS